MKGSVVPKTTRKGERRWQARYPWQHPITHRWTSRSAGTFRTERQAWTALREHLRKQDRGGVAINGLTLGDVFAGWLRDSRGKGLAHNTLVGYEQSVNRWLQPLLGNRQAQAFKVVDAQQVRNHWVAHCTSARANRNMRHLSQALQYAVRAELLDRNVAALVGLPKHEHTNKGWYGIDQWRALEAVARDYRAPVYDGTSVPWGPRLMASLLTGLRQGQLSGLTWADLDRFGKFVVRDVAEYRRGEGRTLKTQHNAKGEPRLVEVPLRLRPFLETQRKWWRQRKLEARMNPDFHDLDLIFPDAWGLPPSTALYHRHFVRMMDLAGLPRIRPHDLRRSFASVLKFEMEEDLTIVSRLLGHKSTKTTELYLGLAVGAESAALKRLDERL